MHFRASKERPAPHWFIYFEERFQAVRVNYFEKKWVGIQRLDGVKKRIAREDWAEMNKSPIVLKEGTTHTYVVDWNNKGRHDLEKWDDGRA